MNDSERMKQRKDSNLYQFNLLEEEISEVCSGFEEKAIHCTQLYCACSGEWLAELLELAEPS